MNKPHKHSYDSTGKCSCGYAHVHLQSNEHEYAHGHSHQELFGESNEVPAVFSQSVGIKFKEEITGEELKARLTDWMEGLKDWVSKNKYFIGHIKLFIENEDGFTLWLSTTGKEINIKAPPERQPCKIRCCTVNMTAIVFGTDEQTLRTVSLENLNNVI